MSREEKGEILVGLDLGTTKVCCVIAEAMAAGAVDVIGVGTSPSKGLKKGVVVDLESTIDSITKAIVDAERMAGVKVSSVYVGINGEHIKGINSKGMIAVSRGDKEISETDKHRVIETARTIAFPSDREIIHILPQEYIVDEQKGIKDPVGMSGVQLQVNVHIITASQTALQNIIKSVNRAGFGVDGVILQSLAAAEAVLTQDEKEMGVALVDVGGGTTDLALFFDGSLYSTSVIGVGGIQVTNDLAIGLRTSNQQAEDIKRSYGCAMISSVEEGEEIVVSGMSGKSRNVSRRFLAEIIEPRLEEIFALIDQQIKKDGYEERIGAGIVLTGGTCLLTGSSELAEKVLNVPVRIGSPQNIGGLSDTVNSPFYATGVGLVLSGLRNIASKKTGANQEGGIVSNVFQKAKKWMEAYF